MSTESLIYKFNATNSSMRELLIKLEEKKEAEDLCNEFSLTPSILKLLFGLSMQGFNNTEIAQKIGVHRITIQRYAATLKKMDLTDIQRIYKYVSLENEDEKRDKN